MNSLSIGLWRGIQFGIVPVMYMLGKSEPESDGSYSEHTSNYNLKWTIYSTKKSNVAVAYSYMNFHTHFGTPVLLPSGASIADADVGVMWSTIVINYYFEDSQWALGVNLTDVSLSSENKELNEDLVRQNTGSESIYDLNYIINSSWAATFGVGKIKESAFEFEKAYYGYGVTATYNRSTNWFNKISLGVHHFNDIQANKILFSFSI
jgi:hypothetical protein